MKLIVFSDLHGNSYALDAFLHDTKHITYDYMVFCGDIFGYYYNQEIIINSLMTISNLIWLKGNHDQYFIDICNGKPSNKFVEMYGHSYYGVEKKYDREIQTIIASHPSSYLLEDKGKKIGIFHGSLEDNLEGRIYPDTEVDDLCELSKYDIVIVGHTHCRIKKYFGNTLLVNSGSLGQPRDGNGYGYAIVDTEEKNVEFYNVKIDEKLLYDQIDKYDSDLHKLKDVLERKKQ